MPSDMLVEEFRELLAMMHLTPHSLAKLLHIDERTARRMGSGHEPVFDEVASWLRETAPKVAQVYASNPPPVVARPKV